MTTTVSDHDLHGWTLTAGEDVHGHPKLEGTKRGFLTMGEVGEHGIDPAVLRQRLLPRLFEQELAVARSPSDIREWHLRLHGARTARDMARRQRTEARLSGEPLPPDLSDDAALALAQAEAERLGGLAWLRRALGGR